MTLLIVTIGLSIVIMILAIRLEYLVKEKELLDVRILESEKQCRYLTEMYNRLHIDNQCHFITKNNIQDDIEKLYQYDAWLLEQLNSLTFQRMENNKTYIGKTTKL